MILHSPDSLRLSSFELRWLAEALRRREERSGPLEDREAVAAACTAGGGLEARVLRRAQVLGEREGLAAGVTSWVGRARLATLLLGALALASGFGAAVAVLGDGTRAVNVVWALGGLLGIHLLSLLLWLAGLGLGGRDGGGLLGRAWLGLSSRLSGARETVDVTQALVGLLGPPRLLRWWLGAVTHGVWLAALAGAVVGLIVTLATRRYGFVWETTILPADAFVRAVRLVGGLPAQFGFAMPDAEAVRASGDAVQSGEAARIAWSSWLLGCVVAYGVVPRLFLASVCFGLWRSGRSRLRIDVALPGYAVLVPRLMPASERIGVTDADPGRMPGPHVEGRRSGGTGRAMLVALELAGQADWPPPLPPGASDAGVVDSREDRKQAVAALRADPPARLLVACDARQSPDRGSLELIAELSRHANDSRVLLVGAGQMDAGDRRQHWRDGLRGIGMASERVDDNPARALAWLGATEREDG
ncbi:DUF2868 domain-containing protein [Aromatoleum sp.]|uniref:DUF2868 domain-containing protein n=1 Tax=Aromatoleum sp. TaxID=2307007 RepID=UPI002FC9C80A